MESVGLNWQLSSAFVLVHDFPALGSHSLIVFNVKLASHCYCHERKIL